ncbi:MAG TPA: hypothetical protein VGN52_19415 [Burkholderiales bacterium]|jgi:hypothetical protein
MRVLACALAFLLLAAAANVVIDPLGIFFVADVPGLNHYKPEILNYWRVSLPMRARMVKPQTVILGSSRSLLGLDPKGAGPEAFNFSVPGATTCELRDALQIALEGGRLKRAVIELDFFAATARRINPDCGLPEARDHPWRLLAQTVLSSDTLNASLKTVTKQRKVDPAIWQPGPDGHAHLDPGFNAKTGGPRARFTNMEQVYTRDYYLMPPVCGFVLERTGSGSLDYLRKLLDLAYANHIETRLFFSPEHARQLALIDDARLFPVYEAWMRGVLRVSQEAAVAAGQAPFPVSTNFEKDWVTEPLPASPDADTRWIIDGTHYTPAAGRAILAKVMGPPQSVDVTQEMARLHALMQSYFSAHPQERAEIDATFAAARRECKN